GCAAQGAGAQTPAPSLPPVATPTFLPTATSLPTAVPTQVPPTPIPAPTPLGGYGSNNPPPVSVFCPTNAELEPIVGNPEDIFSEGTIGNHTACSFETVNGSLGGSCLLEIDAFDVSGEARDFYTRVKNQGIALGFAITPVSGPWDDAYFGGDRL